MVAGNNAPLIGLATGSVSIDARAWELVVYVAMCLAIALFEECAVRGVVFPLFLLGAKRSKWGVLWAILLSSAVFGLLHLVNLLGGASLGAVILQVGYTFLIGAMCGLVLMVTRSIWWCVGIHFVYDIGGLMSGNILSAGSVLWDTPTVVLTAVLSVLVVGYGLFVFWKSDSVAAAGELLGEPFAPPAGEEPSAGNQPAGEKPLMGKESSEESPSAGEASPVEKEPSAGSQSAGDDPSVGEEPSAEKKPPVDSR